MLRVIAMGHAICDDCKQAMDPGVGCTLTHVGKTENGPWTKRVLVGEPGDFGLGLEGVCHDCNAGPGQVHHAGCDGERCPSCGAQMLMCWGESDEFGGCGWEYGAILAPVSAGES